jgi:hypothetical protein
MTTQEIKEDSIDSITKRIIENKIWGMLWRI